MSSQSITTSRTSIAKRISERAVFLHERLAQKQSLKTRPQKNESHEHWKTYREFWVKKVAGNHESAFQKRLQTDQILEEDLPVLLTKDWKSYETSPHWNIPDELVEYIKSQYAKDEIEKDKDYERPFEPVTALVARFWLQKYTEVCAEFDVTLSEEGYQKLEKQLHRSISSILDNVLYQIFDEQRNQVYGIIAGIQPKKLSDTNNVYRSFVETNLENGFFDLFHSYPVLARFLGERIGRSVDQCRIMFERLQNDRKIIQSELTIDPDLKQLESLDLFMSDRHFGHQMVTRFQFAGGNEVIYKPRSSRQEATWFRMVEKVNERYEKRRIKHNLKMPAIISRGDYSWVEVIPEAYPETEEERRRYHYRLGMLLALAGFMGANDFHNENLIPSSDYPVIIDHEVFTTSGVLTKKVSQQEIKAFNHLHHITYMLTSGLMPMFRNNTNGSVDGSAYSVAAVTKNDIQSPKWEDIGTDGMSKTMDWNTEKDNDEEIRYNPYQFTDATRDGFEAVRSECSFSELAALIPEDLEYRVIIRNTSIYGRFLMSAFKPRYLKDGLLFSLFTDQLMRTTLFGNRDIDASVFKDELRQFLNFDIPYFSGKLNENTIYGRDKNRPLSEDLPVRALSRIKEMNSEAEDDRKTAIISRAIKDTNAIMNRVFEQEQTNLLKKRERSSSASSKEEKKAFVQSMMKHLSQQTTTVDDSLIVMSLNNSESSPRSVIGPVRLGLYGGISGIAIFAEAVNTHIPDEESKRWTSGFGRELERVIESPHLFIDENQIDLFSGVAGNISAFSQCARISGKSIYVEAAESLARSIDFTSLRVKKYLDLGSGIPGYITALLQLAAVTENKTYTKRAEELYHILSKNIIKDPVPHLKTMDGKALAGFSHGQSGVASALLKLYKQTGKKEPLELALSMLEYENSLWSEEAQNWMDLRIENYEQKEHYMCSWCHGGTGIGLNRLQMMELCDGDWIKRDLERAIEATLHQRGEGKDGMCCGLSGRALFLRKAGKVLQRGELIQASEELTAIIIQNYNRNGFLLLNSGLSDLFMQPDFFQGYSGVGYQVLASLDDVNLPDVLSFE